jgi:hypothetical protein
MFPQIHRYVCGVVLTVAMLGATSARGNVLVNPGFEAPDASAGDQYAVGGPTVGWAGFNGAFITATTKETGLQSFKAFGNPGGAFQEFPAAPAQVWSGTVKSENFSGDPLVGQQGTFINIEWFNSTGGQISFLSTPIVNSLTPFDTWITGNVSGTAPAGTATARLVLLSGPYTGIGSGAGGAGFFDNASFVVVPEPGSLCLLGIAGLLSLRRSR